MALFKKKKKIEEVGKIVVCKNNEMRNIEGYDRLKDNVLYLNADGNKKVIQIESSVASEGKTTVLCNLAVCLGATNKKVVVVDLDFRRPKTHRVFKLSKDIGIAEYMLDEKGMADIVKKTEYENVDLITRGAEIANSSLVLVSEKFKSFIAELREKYDYVLLDCAPVLQVSDYIHISKVSDGVIFVVAHARTNKAQVAEAISLLKKNEVNLFGSVFSMYDRKKDKVYGGASGYYSYKYYTSSESEEEEQEEKE